MKPQPTGKQVSDWHRKFAWLPVRSRAGDLLWLRTVLERQAEISMNTISITKIIKEYDTPARVIWLRLQGKE